MEVASSTAPGGPSTSSGPPPSSAAAAAAAAGIVTKGGYDPSTLRDTRPPILKPVTLAAPIEFMERMNATPKFREEIVLRNLYTIDKRLEDLFASLTLVARNDTGSDDSTTAVVKAHHYSDLYGPKSFDEILNDPVPALEDLDVEVEPEPPVASTSTVAVREVKELTPEEKERKAKLKNGIGKFNIKAKSGIAFCEENGLLDKTPAAHAYFLLNTPNLNKSQIGQYLGSISNPFIKQVFDAFLGSFNFSGKDLLESLRLFLSKFRLPGEAAQIDFMMEKFSGAYLKDNPEVSMSPDGVYILSFALIMLNTDLHSPSIKDSNRMTLQQFMSTTRGIDNGKDIDASIITRYYQSIKVDELKMDQEGSPSAFDNPDKAGFLRKQGGAYKSWKKRHFVLTGNCLYYFEDDKEGRSPKGILPLENLAVRPTGPAGLFQFEIYHPSEKVVKAGKLQGGTMKESRHERFLLQAANQEDLDEWVQAVGNHVTRDPLFNLLSKKRQELEEKKNDRKLKRTGSTSTKIGSSPRASKSESKLGGSGSFSGPSSPGGSGSIPPPSPDPKGDGEGKTAASAAAATTTTTTTAMSSAGSGPGVPSTAAATALPASPSGGGKGKDAFDSDDDDSGDVVATPTYNDDGGDNGSLNTSAAGVSTTASTPDSAATSTASTAPGPPPPPTEDVKVEFSESDGEDGSEARLSMSVSTMVEEDD